MVGQRDAGELGHGAAAQRDPPLDEPRDTGQLAGLGEVEQVAAVRAVPQDPDDPALPPVRQPLEVCREHPAVERIAFAVNEIGVGDAGQVRDRRPHVHKPGMFVAVADAADASAASTSGARDWITSSEPCSPWWPPSSGK